MGYTAGAFDLFHVGHLNLLLRAKEHCDKLIVGVTTDDLIERTKRKKPFVCLEDRMRIIEALSCVDQVVVQKNLDKVRAWEQLHYDILFSGDDWKGNPRWVGYEQELAKRGVSVLYFPYTQSISSSKIQKLMSEVDVG